MSEISLIWLEITGRCQLRCAHCYADSGPLGSHGSMTDEDWLRILDQAADLGAEMVQFIGGEPTLNPALPTLISHALKVGIQVEVFSNLLHLSPALWKAFGRDGVRLACSYYSDEASQHEAVTGRSLSHAKTRANIAEAVARSIPLRVGVIDLGDKQRVRPAIAELESLGVTDIAVDHLRQIGRGIRDVRPGFEQLCGQCASDVLAISPDGNVWPCVFSRWLTVGNVKTSPLADVLGGPAFRRTWSQPLTATRRSSGPR
jgi:MoaA/NifB/PqqE/SkfB family radical SAM enzyme